MAKWLSGKRTYILAAGMFVCLAVLLFYGKLTPELAFEVLVFAAPCFAATFRAAIQTNHSQVLDVLMDAVDAGVAVRSHNYAALEHCAERAAADVNEIAVSVSADPSRDVKVAAVVTATSGKA